MGGLTLLGKTHMAIGALGAVIATPLLLHTQWNTLPQELSHIAVLHGSPKIPASLAWQTEWVVASLVGSIAPDFDEQHSLMARRAEGIVQIVLVIALVAVFCLLKLALSPLSWLFVILLCLGLITRANLMRRIALGALGVAALSGAFLAHLPVLSGLFFAAWCVCAMFSSHRTFTHSALGWGLFSYASISAFTQFHLAFMGTAVSVGYLLHIAADVPSGGVSLLWPLPMHLLLGQRDLESPRFGVGLIQTGGMVDHIVGALALAVFAVLSVFQPNQIHL